MKVRGYAVTVTVRKPSFDFFRKLRKYFEQSEIFRKVFYALRLLCPTVKIEANMKHNIAIPTSWKIFWTLIFISISLFSFSLYRSFNSQTKSISSANASKKNILPTIIISPQPENVQPTEKIELKKSLGTVIITTPNPTITNPTNTINQNTSKSDPQQNVLKVNLSINDGPSFSIELPSGSNQCDVLNKALSDGKISSLNMKYLSSMSTYGVYQINGIGKGEQVWWVYKVNGISPSQGCNHVKVNNNDSVNWSYLGTK